MLGNPNDSGLSTPATALMVAARHGAIGAGRRLCRLPGAPARSLCQPPAGAAQKRPGAKAAGRYSRSACLSIQIL